MIRKRCPRAPTQAVVATKSRIFIKALLTQLSEVTRVSEAGSTLFSPPSPSKDKTWEVQGTSGNPAGFSSLMEFQLLDSPWFELLSRFGKMAL